MLTSLWRHATGQRRVLVRARSLVRGPSLVRTRSRARGQSLVEFALVLPIILVLLSAAADLGRLFYAFVSIENAAKEGAFYGALNPRCDVAKAGCVDPNTVDWRVRNELTGVTISAPVSQCLDAVTSAPKPVNSCGEGDTYRVEVRHTFRLITPILGQILGDQLLLGAGASSLVINAAIDPTATPEPTASPACVTVPNLVGMTVGDARTAWTSAGFTGAFNPSNGQNNKTVKTQTTSPASVPGDCLAPSASVSVTYQ